MFGVIELIRIDCVRALAHERRVSSRDISHNHAGACTNCTNCTNCMKEETVDYYHSNRRGSIAHDHVGTHL